MIKRGGANLVGEIKGRSGGDKNTRIRGAGIGPWRGGFREPSVTELRCSGLAALAT